MSIPVPAPRIERFEKLGFGMFIHWGLYSQLAKGEWIQYFLKTSREDYARLADTFTAEKFDAREIARLAKRSGMKYIVLTTRHHEGFSLYDTKGLSEFDAVHSPAKRDLIAEFVQGCNEEGIIPFFYHTTLDWHVEEYESNFPKYLQYLRNSVEVLCTNYGPVGGFWFDGNWDRLDADWQETELYSIIRKHQPDAVIVNNPGWRFAGKLTHAEVDVACFEQGQPHLLNREGMEKYVACEMAQTISDHWGAGRKDFSAKSLPELIKTLCKCRGAGANYLLNVTPDGAGSIPGLQKALLEKIGEWIEIFKKPVYDGKPYPVKGYGSDFALETPDGKIYIFVFDLNIEGNENVTINRGGRGPRSYKGINKKITSVRWMDNGEELPFFQDISESLVCFNATGFDYGCSLVVRVAELS